MAEDDKGLQDRVRQLEDENARLRGDLAAAGARPASAAPALPQLTEAGRLELEQLGHTSIGGVVYTRDEVLRMLPAMGQEGVTIGEPAKEQQAAAERLVGGLRRDPDTGQRQVAQRGVTHVWPSIEPGGIDPSVAGTPGISGPAAGSTTQDLLETTPAANVPTTPDPGSDKGKGTKS